MIKEIGMPEDDDDKMTFSGHELSNFENSSCFISTISGEQSCINVQLLLR